MSDKMHNLVIVGGGPAGLSAAIYAARANLEPVVLAGSPPGGQLMLTTEVENYPGFTRILGPELIQKMREQALEFGTNIEDVNVKEVDFSGKVFSLKTPKHTYNAKAVIIATGAQALWLGLESETRLRGRGVSACATCDGLFFRNKVVGVVGGGDTAMEEALTLAKIAKKVYIIHRRNEFKASKIMQERIHKAENIEILWNTMVEEVLGEQKVEGLKLKKTQEGEEEITTLQLDGLFVAIGHKPDTDIFHKSLLYNDAGYITTSSTLLLEEQKNKRGFTDEEKSFFHFEYTTGTSIPGVFAAGDCVDYIYRQASTSVGAGVAASLDAERWLGEQE